MKTSNFINGEMPDTDLFLKKIKEFTEREGYAPVIKDIKSQLGWGDKKAFDIVEKLESSWQQNTQRLIPVGGEIVV